jgi:hypothetical protein
MSTNVQTKATTKHSPRRPEARLFITKSEIGRALGVKDLRTIDAWIASGTFPPPHSRPGERFAVWLRKHWLVYVETGRWPEEAFRG